MVSIDLNNNVGNDESNEIDPNTSHNAIFS